MHNPRSWALAVACVLIASLVVAVAPGAATRSSARSSADSASIRSMLKQVDPDRVEASIRKLVSFGTRNTLSVQDNPVRGIGAARDWLFDEFGRYAEGTNGRLTVQKQSYLDTSDDVPRPTVITNVVATLKGSQAGNNRVYVVSGHYDSRCGNTNDGECDAPGANDDASGVAAVLELARVMSKREWDSTLVFMAVAGEEQGLLGANHFATTAKAAGMNIAGMHTNDIIGSSVGGNGIRDPRTVRVFSEGVPTSETDAERAARIRLGGENDGPSRQLARFIKEVGEENTNMRVKMITRRDRFGRGGDHIPFLEQGWTAVRFTETNEHFAHQHQNVRIEDGMVFGDLIEFVDFGYTARVARVNGATLAAQAEAPTVPRPRIAGGLEYNTRLSWPASPEPDVAGYEVVWREMDEPTWTHTIPVGNVTNYTVERMSKDNFFFGVRAVDSDGNRSPVGFAR